MPVPPSSPPKPQAPSEGPSGAEGGGTASSPRYASEAIFGNATEVLIEHHGALYRLRRTSLGKLILTK